MLPRKNRLDTKTVEEIFERGRFINSPNLTFKFLINSKATLPRISFIAPKSVAKLAVKRNLLRRRGYIALAKYINKCPRQLVGVFVFRKYQEDISTIEDEIKNILSKIN